MSSRAQVVLAREASRFPGTLLGVCLLLLAISVVVLKSASLQPDGSLGPYMNRQLVWASVGLATFFGASLIPYPKLGRRAWIVYLVGLAALGAVLFLGTKINGSRRWFDFGVVRVQPSELMKYVLVITLAHVVARRGEEIKTWGGLLEAGVISAIPFGFVMLQPDLGTSLTFIPIAGAIVFAAGARLLHLGLLAAAALASLPLAWLFVFKDYQKDRVLSFLTPTGDRALEGAYQTNQSMIAIGNGGLWGRGYMEGTQGPLGFLPERHTDFVFGVIGEDFGLVGAAALLGLYGYLICVLGQIATRTRDPEGRLLVVGVTAILATQLAVNVGMAMGLTPVTGLTLPLVSYGGSSLVAAMCGFGLAASVARHRVRMFVPAGD
ncbi:MAG: rod shape-determining protein RodA [Planctomycetes bacterium]|nr:rod shape-determining protein RodA [Planctomycetota bacterium]